MSQDLIDAISSWEIVVSTNQTTYSDYLVSLKIYKEDLLGLTNELSVLNAEYTALEGVQKVRIEAGMDYSDVLEDMTLKQAEIDTKNLQITVATGQIDSIEGLLENIVSTCSFSNNFTPSQLTELNEFIYENTYKNDNIIMTDTMSQAEIQDQQEILYEQGVSVLDRISQPRYEFSFDGVNILSIKDFDSILAELNVGCEVTAEVRDGSYITAVLLEISFSFHNPEEFSMTFSNRLRLDNGNYVYSDLMGSVIRTNANLAFNFEKFSNWEDNHKSDVSAFITSSLDASVNTVINAQNQEITLGANGLRGRTFIAEGVYDPMQVWLTSSLLVFTSDNWETAKAALGRVTVDGNTYYGLVAEHLVGNIIIGESIRISNENNTFLVNATGAYLNNASLAITSGSNSRIYLDPGNSFLIQKNSGGSWVDRFRVNTSTGDVTFSGALNGATGNFTGSISALSGNIGGWSISYTGMSYTAPKGATGGKSPDERGHASGGDFLIPTSYGNEGFRLGNGDTASGGERITITPKGGKAGVAVYNITINNPKKEAAENSIRNTLKSLSYTGGV